MKKTFGEKFEEMRHEKRITIKQVADAIGKSSVYVSDVQRGYIKHFTIEEIDKLIPILGTQIAYLYGEYVDEISFIIDQIEKDLLQTRDKNGPGIFIKIQSAEKLVNYLRGK